jgi:hypothetical protein
MGSQQGALMVSYVIGGLLFVLGLLASTNSLDIVKRAVRVWPRPLSARDGEAIASSEFLVKFVGLMVALAGVALIVFEMLRGT